MVYLDTLYVVGVKNIIQIRKWSFFSVLKTGFHGDTFVAREHSTNAMFQFFLKF